MCQQSFKQKCTAFGDSLKEIRDNVPDQQQLSQPEVADVYGAQLDALNAKYERLLSHFQQLIDNAKGIDADREVSHCGHENVCHLHGSLKNLWSWSREKLALNAIAPRNYPRWASCENWLLQSNKPSRGLMDVFEHENSSIVDGLRTNYQQFE